VQPASIFEHGYQPPIVEYVPSEIDVTPLTENNKTSVSTFNNHYIESLMSKVREDIDA
jgi:hypothetical protein